MKNRYLILAALAAALFPAAVLCARAPEPQAVPAPAPEASAPAQTLTFEDCYRLALAQSELLAVDAERVKQAEARFLQALGTALPQLSLNRKETVRDSAASDSENRDFDQKFVLKQTLFSGFKEFCGMSGSRFEKQQYEHLRRRAEELLWADVADAFYLLLQTRRDLQALETIRAALAERVAELKEREKLGKSRTSEVVSTQTQLLGVEDEIEAGRAGELVARQLLEFLVGRPVGDLSEPGTAPALESESAYLARAASRADVLAADFARRADLKRLAVARSGFYPTLTLQGDYFTHRDSQPSDSDWDAVFTLDVPLFNGTITYGQGREAAAAARQSRLLFARAARAARQDIASAYANARSAFVREKILEQALRSAELNFELQTRDYRLSVVNNLEVLQALQDLEDIRRKHNGIVCESRRLLRRLQSAAGRLPGAPPAPERAE